MAWRIGIDIGGTFTDFTVVDDAGQIWLWKQDSTPDDPGEAIRLGLESVALRAGAASTAAFLADSSLVVHGSTIATNTLIQRNGARVGLVCTEGFRDTVYFRDGFKWDRFNRHLQHPRDFVDRFLRLGVDERVDVEGDILVPLNEQDVRDVAATFREAGVEAIAVALLWSIVNDRHERRVAEILAEELPEVPVLLSSDVLPEIREWEQTSATVLSAYVLPKIAGYLSEFESFLTDNGLTKRPLIMQINGGCATPDQVLARPVNAVASGPAAAPAAGTYYGSSIGARDLITIDMGGTSFDVCLIRDGSAAMSRSMQIEFAPIGVPGVEVHSIGAGGGSIAWVDSGGALRVGPRSAGARPGPACYGLGGEEPTVTDANLALGRLSEDAFLGGRRTLQAELAREALRTRVAEPLGLSVEDAAAGVVRVVNANMVDAIKEVSVQRGIDPRGFALVVGGGAGGLHAGRLAAELGMGRVLIPAEAGVLCSFGMTVTDVRHDHSRALHTLSSEIGPEKMEALFAELELSARETLKADGFADEQMELRRFVDARYPNQVHELTIPVPRALVDLPDAQAEIEKIFHAQHEQQFTYSIDSLPIEIIHWRVAGVGAPVEARTPAPLPGDEPGPAAEPIRERPVYFDEQSDFVEAPIFSSELLEPGTQLPGPAVVESENTTVVAFPGQTLRVLPEGAYILELSGDPPDQAQAVGSSDETAS